MLSYLLPREVGSQSVDFGAVVPYEENQVLCREVSRIPSIRQRTRLDNLTLEGQPPNAWKGNEEGTYEFDKLALNDIFYQIYCLRERFLYLTKDEHLQRTANDSWTSPGLDFALRTIWEISCWYLYSFFFSPTSAGAAVVFLAGVIICSLTMTNWTVTGSG